MKTPCPTALAGRARLDAEAHLRGRDARRGFSFVEILLATVVVVFGLGGVLALIEINASNTHKASQRAIAVHLGRMKAAEIQAAGYAAVKQLMNGKQEFRQPEKNRLAFPDNPKFAWRVIYKQTGDARIDWDVNVSWSAGVSGNFDEKHALEVRSLTYGGYLEAGASAP